MPLIGTRGGSDATILASIDSTLTSLDGKAISTNQEFGYGLGFRTGNDLTTEITSIYMGGTVTTTERTIGIPIGCSVDRAARPTTSSVVSITSTSANDTSAGTGARDILVIGLDGSWNPQIEFITPNGLTPVLGSLSFIRVDLLIVNDVGSTEQNDGDIYASFSGETYSSGVPTTAVRCAIELGKSLSSWGMRAVPLGRRNWYMGFDYYTSATEAKPITLFENCYLNEVSASGIPIKITLNDLTLSSGIHFQSPATPPINEKADIEYTAIVGTSTEKITVFIQRALSNMP